jgi:hypothetical protein
MRSKIGAIDLFKADFDTQLSTPIHHFWKIYLSLLQFLGYIAPQTGIGAQAIGAQDAAYIKNFYQMIGVGTIRIQFNVKSLLLNAIADIPQKRRIVITQVAEVFAFYI